MEITITTPDSVIAGRTMTVSVLVENKGWEDKQDVSFLFGSDGPITAAGQSDIVIDRISAGSSYGDTLDFTIDEDAAGMYFLNVEYAQTLLVNNDQPQEPTDTRIAIPITVLDRPKVLIHTSLPESIFTDADFPLTVEILSENVDINDVTVRIVAPPEAALRGETTHVFSSLQKGMPTSVTSRIVVPEQQIEREFVVPFQVVVEYVDDAGEQKTDSQTISTVMRPRTFFELTSGGGFWVGDFFIAPYVSLGTIIGIPAGAILSLLVRRSRNKKREDPA